MVNDAANSVLIYDSALTNYQLQETALRYPLRNSLDTLLTSPDSMRHQKKSANIIRCQHERPHILKQHFWFLLVSVVVLYCPGITGGGI